MARINKSALTKLEIIRVASRLFLEQGYTNTSIKMICQELDMSPGNVTFYFPSKEHLLGELVDLLCEFRRRRIEKETDEGASSILAICLELTAMITMCDDPIARDFLLAAYTSPLCLEIIRENDTRRAKEVFTEYRPDWTHEQFVEAEILVSGIEYATLTTTVNPASLETRITGALENILSIYGVPAQMRETKIKKVISRDYRNIAKNILVDFKKYVDESNEQAFMELLGR